MARNDLPSVIRETTGGTGSEAEGTDGIAGGGDAITIGVDTEGVETGGM